MNGRRMTGQQLLDQFKDATETDEIIFDISGNPNVKPGEAMLVNRTLQVHPEFAKEANGADKAKKRTMIAALDVQVFANTGSIRSRGGAMM